MKRRQYLAGLGVSSMTIGLAGCADVLETGGLSVTDYRVDEQGGGLVIRARIENLNPSSSSSGVLVGQVDIDGETVTERESVTVGAGSSRTFSLQISPGFWNSVSGFQYGNVDVWVESD